MKMNATKKARQKRGGMEQQQHASFFRFDHGVVVVGNKEFRIELSLSSLTFTNTSFRSVPSSMEFSRWVSMSLLNNHTAFGTCVNLNVSLRF